MTPSAEVRRRERLALPLLAASYGGVPLLLLGLAVAVELRSAEEDDRAFDLMQVVPALVMLLVGGFLLYRNRARPVRWASSGVAFGAAGGFFVFGIVAIRSIGLDDPLFDGLTYAFPFAAAAAAGLCGLLGWAARRVLSTPVVPELAQSRYAWSFPVRDAKRVHVDVDHEQLAILEHYSHGTGETSRSGERGERLLLSSLTRVELVHIDGYGGRVQPVLPAQIQTPVGAEPGPALLVQAGSAQWVVPVVEAPAVVGLIQRRLPARSRS